MPSHAVAQALLEGGRALPLAAPSANRFGRISPTTAAHVVQELGDRIGIVLDGGASTVGVESTVVAIANDGTLTLLRPGGVSVEAIEATASVRLARTPVTAAPGVPAPSPGHERACTTRRARRCTSSLARTRCRATRRASG